MKGVKCKMNEKKQVCNETSTLMPWPDLPDQLIKLISKKLCLLDYVSFDGVAKTWRSTSKKCDSKNHQFLLLELSNLRTTSCHDTHLVYSIPELPWYDEWRFRRIPCTNDWSTSGYQVIGSSHGQIIMRGTNSVYHGLFRFPIRDNYIDHLPPLYDQDINLAVRRIVVSRKPDFKTSAKVLVLTGTGSGSKPAGFMFCSTLTSENQLENRKWIKEECTILDPNSYPISTTIEFTNAVALKGKFYALSLQGTLAVIGIIDSDIAGVTILGSAKRAVPSVMWRCFREFLVESGGEILLIFLLSKKSFNKVDDVEVFRLHFTSVSWIKMESLGDRTLFIGLNCCMAISARELGCKVNCIYFRQNVIDGWLEFNMGDGTITPGWNDANFNI